MLLTVLLVAWPISEIVLGVARRAKRGSASVRDRGSLVLLWVVICASMISGAALQFVEVGRVAASAGVLRLVALGLLIMGLAIRWSAILTLGRFFNTNVSIHAGHRIVRSGLYRFVRHPSYSGLLLAFAAVGIVYGSWLSLAAILLPISAALIYRMRVEERALLETFGQQYADYRETTKRLIPWIY